MRLYETVFIVRPDLEPPGITAIRDMVKDLLAERQAPQVRWESWGKRKLAYPIAKHPKGIYLYVLYLGVPEDVKEVERVLKLHEDVLRHMTTRVLEDVDSASFDFEGWAAKLNPLADRKDAGEYDEVADDDGKPSDRRSKSESSSEETKKEEKKEEKTEAPTTAPAQA